MQDSITTVSSSITNNSSIRTRGGSNSGAAAETVADGTARHDTRRHGRREAHVKVWSMPTRREWRWRSYIEVIL